VSGETVGQGCDLEVRNCIGMHCTEEEIGPGRHGTEAPAGWTGRAALPYLNCS